MTRETIAIGAVGATLLVALVGLGALLRADVAELRRELSHGTGTHTSGNPLTW